MRYSKQLILLVVITVLCLSSFWIIYGEVRKSTIADLNSRQTAHARQAAKGLQDHFRHLADILTILSWQDGVISMDASGKTILKDVQRTYASEIKGVTRVDAQGRIMFTAPMHAASIGSDISGQVHVAEIMRTHKPVISDVFMAVQGFRAVALHVPVFKDGVYEGTLAFLISFDQLAKQYLEDIRIGKNGYSWLISRNGTVIYSPDTTHISTSVFDTFRASPEIVTMARRMLEGRSGVMDYTIVHRRGTKTKKTLEHAIYMPISLDTTFWSIVVATPDDEVASLMEGFREKLFFMTVALFAFMAVFTYFLIKLRIVLREQAKRRSIEEALHQEHQRLLDIIEFLPDAVFVIDKDKKIVAWNRAIEYMSGMPKEKMLGKGDYEYALPFFGTRRPILIDLLDLPDEELEKSYKYVKRSGKMIYAESYIPTLFGGEGAHLWGVAVPLHDAQGNRNGAIEAIRDVTLLKNKEETLQRTNRALRLLSQGNAVIINAREEGELIRRICHLIVESAGYLMAWVGYTEEDAGKHVRPVAQYGFEEGYLDFIKITYDDSEYGKGPTGTAIRTGQRAILKNILTQPSFAPWHDQAIKRGYNSSIALPLTSRGHTFGALNIYARDPDAFHDDEATLLEELCANLAHGIMALRARFERTAAMEALEKERAELETRVQARTHELQEANTRLKELDRLKSMFIASVSHELRTPLNSIIGFSGVLLQGLSGELNARQRDQMERIQRAGKHLVQLIMDVIDVSKIEAGNIPAVPGDFDLAELMREAEQSLRADIEAKGLTFMVDLPDGVSMHTDRRRLLQCILNFLSNAYKFTPAGVIRMWSAVDGDEVSITVSDTGIGIPPEQTDRLFQAFVRLDSPLKTTVPGTGLGLYLTRKIAEELLLGGVSMRGNLEQGSVFTIQVPRRLPDKPGETKT